MSESRTSELAALLPDLKRELQEWLELQTDLATRIENRTRLIYSLERELAYSGSSEGEKKNGNRAKRLAGGLQTLLTQVATGLTTGQACLRVIEESPTPLTGSEVYRELEQRGWAPTDVKDARAAVGSALWYLARQQKIQALGDEQTRRWARNDFAPPEGGAKSNPQPLQKG